MEGKVGDTMRFTENSNVKLPLRWLVSIMSALGLAVWFLAKIYAKLDGTWSTGQQIIYSRQLERANPELKVPDPIDCCGAGKTPSLAHSSGGH